MRCIQIHYITPYPASCLVRDDAGRPKTANIGGVTRGRVSKAAVCRAVRLSDAFAGALDGALAVRTRRIGEIVAERLAAEMDAEAAKAAAKLIVPAFGKADTDTPLRTNQVAFIAGHEVDAAVEIARRAAQGHEPTPEELSGLWNGQVRAVDVALFGRMLAQNNETRKVTAAVSMAHPFTVSAAPVEMDFYVAMDDRQEDQDEAGAGFTGHQGFVSGPFYGFASFDVRQAIENLGGDVDLASRGFAAFLKALLTVSPSGKQASFGSLSRAHWAMIEMGDTTPRTLAGAFFAPVRGENQIADAARLATALAEESDRTYGESLDRKSFDMLAGKGTLADLVSAADAFIRA